MNLKKVTIRIVFTLLAVIALGSMIASCSNEEFECPRKTLATRSTAGTEPGNYMKVLSSQFDTICDGLDSKVQVRMSWTSGRVTPIPVSRLSIDSIKITPYLPPKKEVIDYKDTIRETFIDWDLVEINNVQHEECKQYYVPFDFHVVYSITITYRDKDDSIKTITQNPIVSFRKYIPCESDPL